MVQIIEENRRPQRERPPSMTDRFKNAFATAVDVGTKTYLSEYEKKQSKEKKDREDQQVKQLIGLDISGIQDPKVRLEVVKEGMKAHKLNDTNSIYAKGLRGEELTEEEMSKLPVNAQTQLNKARNPKEPVKRLSEKPIEPEQLEAKRRAKATPGYKDMNELEKLDTLIENGVAPSLAEQEAKLTSSKLEREQKSFESSYKAQEDFINKTTDSYKAYETDMKPRLLQMQKIASDSDLISPTAAVFLDTLGIPLGALEDPSSELYNKVSLDLLKGLPETYGNRIMKVEVENFLKTIPTLMNSPEGRRMVASNMLKLGEMKEVYYNEMRRQQRQHLDTSKPLPRDFQQTVFDQVKPQIDRVNNEFVKMSEIKSLPPNTVPFFDPSGNIKFIPKDKAQWASENRGRRIW